jgi:hypothetical protein
MDDNLKIRRLSEPFVGELSGELETLETKKNLSFCFLKFGLFEYF